MALDESFPQEVFDEPLVEETPALAAEAAPETALEVEADPLPADSEPLTPEAEPETAETTPETLEVTAPAAFNEAEYLKSQFG